MAKLAPEAPSFAAIILAGGLGRRMGYRQKGLMQLRNRALIEYALDKVRPYTNNIVISANKEQDQYAAFGYPVIADVESYALRGPLAGIYSAASALASDIEFIQVLPCDTPFLPNKIVEDLHHSLIAEPTKELVVAATKDKVHPVIMQFRRSMLSKLKDYLDDPRELNRVMAFIESCGHGTVNYSDNDRFININDTSLLQGYFDKGQQ